MYTWTIWNSPTCNKIDPHPKVSYEVRSFEVPITFATLYTQTKYRNALTCVSLHVYIICKTYTFALMYMHTLAYLFCSTSTSTCGCLCVCIWYMILDICKWQLHLLASRVPRVSKWSPTDSKLSKGEFNRSTWGPSNPWSLPILPVWCTSTLATHYLGVLKAASLLPHQWRQHDFQSLPYSTQILCQLTLEI